MCSHMRYVCVWPTSKRMCLCYEVGVEPVHVLYSIFCRLVIYAETFCGPMILNSYAHSLLATPLDWTLLLLAHISEFSRQLER